MGGMAMGSFISSRRSPGWRRLLVAYAASEAAIGALGLVFHPLFTSITGFAYEAILPRLGASVTAFKWLLSAALILPQSVLLGMTFPLMTAGTLRAFPDRPGRSIAMLYFTNSMGAAIGVLVTGFWLVPALGLPGTLRVAALINLAVALAVWTVFRRRELENADIAAPQRSGATRPDLRLLSRRSARHRGYFVHLRSGLDPHAHSRSRRLDSFLRTDAERVHPRPRPGRALHPAAHRRAARSRPRACLPPGRNGRLRARDAAAVRPQLRGDELAPLPSRAYRPWLHALQFLQQRHRARRHAPGDLLRRDHATVDHLPPDTAQPRRKEHRRGLCGKYGGRDRRRVLRHTRRSARARPQGTAHPRCHYRHLARRGALLECHSGPRSRRGRPCSRRADDRFRPT